MRSCYSFSITGVTQRLQYKSYFSVAATRSSQSYRLRFTLPVPSLPLLRLCIIAIMCECLFSSSAWLFTIPSFSSKRVSNCVFWTSNEDTCSVEKYKTCSIFYFILLNYSPQAGIFLETENLKAPQSAVSPRGMGVTELHQSKRGKYISIPKIKGQIWNGYIKLRKTCFCFTICSIFYIYRETK